MLVLSADNVMSSALTSKIKEMEARVFVLFFVVAVLILCFKKWT